MENKRCMISTFVSTDFPMEVACVPFIRYSNFPTNTNDENINNQLQMSPKQQKNIIIGGRKNSETAFYEFDWDDKTNSINYKHIGFEHSKKKFANLNSIQLSSAQHLHSYLVGKNKYLVVFKNAITTRYNVYDVKNDKWLLTKKKKRFQRPGMRNVLINDEIIIESAYNRLNFSYIGNDHITDPIKMHTYILKTKNVFYCYHGMCIIDFIIIEQEQSYKTYKLKIVLFGGSENKNYDFFSSFLYLDIILSYKGITLINLSIDEILIDKNEIKLINMNEKTENQKIWCRFGFECILNDKNEALIVIIGGNKSISRNIHWFNCSTYQLTQHEQVSLLIICNL